VLFFVFFFFDLVESLFISFTYFTLQCSFLFMLCALIT